MLFSFFSEKKKKFSQNFFPSPVLNKTLELFNDEILLLLIYEDNVISKVNYIN